MRLEVDHQYVNQLSPLAPSIASAQSFPLGMMSAMAHHHHHHQRRNPLSSTSSSTTSNSAMHSLPGSFGARVVGPTSLNVFQPVVGNGLGSGSSGVGSGSSGGGGKFSSSDEREELSDEHDYYNESQPLNIASAATTATLSRRKNETTV